jgi:arylsulfatase A-like enzyme
VAFISDVPADEPLFLWFAPRAPHGPAEYAPRHANAFPNAGGQDRDRLRTILAVDEAVAAIHAALGPERADRAVWFVLTDNGYLLDDAGGSTGKLVPDDGAVRVPMLARVPGVAAGEDRRLVASIDLAPTIARAAGVDLPVEPDGRALQNEWNRKRVLVESWNTGKNAYGPFVGVRTRCHTYIERPAERILWERCATGEERPVPFDDTRLEWVAWLEALRECAGAVCREADGGQ